MTLQEITYRGPGVYGILNTVTGKYYVGSTCNLRTRARQHYNNLVRGKHTGRKLQNSWNKHGSHVFKLKILARCPSEYCIKLEQWFIDNLDACKNGYNLRPKAESNLGRIGGPSSDKQKEAVRLANLGNKRLAGYKQTPEHIANKILGCTGLLRYPYTGKFLLINLKTKKETLFPDMWRAVEFLGCDKRSMQAVIRGKKVGIYNHSIQITYDSQ